MLFVPYIYVISTVHLCYLYRTFMLFVPYIYVICTVHLCYLYRTFSWLYKIVFRQMYSLYCLLFNTVYIKNSPTCNIVRNMLDYFLI
jgi:hypothetical protein